MVSGTKDTVDDPALWHRLQFAFTITYHYLFPQLTMGLAWFLVYWKWRALRTGNERYAIAARFWARIFGLNFAVGVVTGIPMEFQFGTNWAEFSKFSGGVIGQTLAMEGRSPTPSCSTPSATWSPPTARSVWATSPPICSTPGHSCNLRTIRPLPSSPAPSRSPPSARCTPSGSHIATRRACI